MLVYFELVVKRPEEDPLYFHDYVAYSRNERKRKITGEKKDFHIKTICKPSKMKNGGWLSEYGSFWGRFAFGIYFYFFIIPQSHLFLFYAGVFFCWISIRFSSSFFYSRRKSEENKCTETLANPSRVRKWPILHVALRVSDAELKRKRNPSRFLCRLHIWNIVGLSLFLLLLNFSFICYLCEEDSRRSKLTLETDCVASANCISPDFPFFFSLSVMHSILSTFFRAAQVRNIQTFFLLLLHQTDDSNCIHFAYLAHPQHPIFIIHSVLQNVYSHSTSHSFSTLVAIQLISDINIIAVSYTKIYIKCTWDRVKLSISFYKWHTIFAMVCTLFTYYWQ